MYISFPAICNFPGSGFHNILIIEFEFSFNILEMEEILGEILKAKKDIVLSSPTQSLLWSGKL